MKARQDGIALIGLLALIVLGASWWLVAALATPASRVASDREHNAKVLAQAKTALLGQVAMTAVAATENNPGRLPCPEAPGSANNFAAGVYNESDDGVAAGNCALPGVGRLPWRTLGLDKLVDAAGEPLWYVVSPGWALSNTTVPPLTTFINSNAVGQLTLDADAGVVALIIAPGRARNISAGGACVARNQTRVRQANVAWDLRDFLECENSDGDAVFATSDPAGSSNDQVVSLTATEVLRTVEAAIAARFERDVAPLLRSAYSGVLPFAAPFGDPSANPYNTFQGDAVVSTGTAAVTSGSTTVTLSTPQALSLSGRHFQVGAGDAYLISSHVAGSTILTLTSPYAAATNGGAPYRVFRAQGLLPLSYAYNASPGSAAACSPTPCNPVPCTLGSDPRCNPAFVTWRSTPVVTRTGGGTLHASTNCAVAGTPSVLTCNLRYSTDLFPYTEWMSFTIDATANNVGMVLRQVNGTVVVTGLDGTINPPFGYTVGTAAMGNDGAATVTISGQVNGAGSPLGVLGSLLCSIFGLPLCFQSTVTIPMAIFSDHQFVDPGNTTHAWFYRNNWHQVSYYAAAPNITPSGTGACVTSATCLEVTHHTNAGKHRGLVIFSGRSLASPPSGRPNGNLADWLEGANADGVSPFAVRDPTLTVSRTFNDRIAIIDANP